MAKRNNTRYVGLFFLLLCGSALAHDGYRHDVYPDSGWSGAVVVWGDSRGYSGWSGGLNHSYGVGYGYAPGFIPWAAAHRHGPQCGHGSGHDYAAAYRKGFRHGRGHSNKQAYRHGHHH